MDKNDGLDLNGITRRTKDFSQYNNGDGTTFVKKKDKDEHDGVKSEREENRETCHVSENFGDRMGRLSCRVSEMRNKQAVVMSFNLKMWIAVPFSFQYRTEMIFSWEPH